MAWSTNVTKTKTRDDLIAEIGRRSDIQDTWYVRNNDAHDCMSQFAFCREHAGMVARVEAALHAVDTEADLSFGETDSFERCEFYGCDRALSNGGLTDHGVRSALGLTETDPKAVHCYVEELELAARTMGANDPRWELWEHHARRTLAYENPKGKAKP